MYVTFGNNFCEVNWLYIITSFIFSFLFVFVQICTCNMHSDWMLTASSHGANYFFCCVNSFLAALCVIECLQQVLPKANFCLLSTSLFHYSTGISVRKTCHSGWFFENYMVTCRRLVHLHNTPTLHSPSRHSSDHTC